MSATRSDPCSPSVPAPRATSTLRDGQQSNESIVWYADTAGPYHPTPLVYGDYYFTLLDRGFFTVHDARTGEELYLTEQTGGEPGGAPSRPRAAREASPPPRGPTTARSSWLSEEGDTYVLDTADDFGVVATNSLGEVAMSSPAIARGSLFIRTRSHLWRLSDGSRSR